MCTQQAKTLMWSSSPTIVVARYGNVFAINKWKIITFLQ